MTTNELSVAQNLINQLNKGDRKCIKEIYGEEWNNINQPKEFGKRFKESVKSNKLKNLKHLGIRNNGRCDEYEKI